MTDQERSHVTDLLAAHEGLIHWCEILITAHADLIELQAWVEARTATAWTNDGA